MTTRVRPQLLRLGSAELDLGDGTVRHPDHRVVLTPLETSLLVYLAERPSREVSRAELLANVWGYASGARTRTVDALVHRLRDKLQEPRGRPRHLLTVAGGYRLVPSPPRGREALCEELRQLLGPQAIVTLVGPEEAGKTELARYLAYQLEGLWLEVDSPEPGSVRSAFLREGLDLDRGLWVLDGVGQLDDQEQALLHDAAQSGGLLTTARRPLGLAREHVVRIAAAPTRRRAPEAQPAAARPSERLAPEERAVLEAASLFRGAFLPESLAAVVGRELGPALEVLLGQGLLVRLGEHLELPPPVRVILSDPPPDAARAERYRQQLVRRAREDYWDPHRLRPELDDLSAASEASTHEDLVDLTLAIQRVHSLTWNHPRHRWFGEEALAKTDHPRLWVAMGHWEHRRSRPSEAWRCAERAMALATTPMQRAEAEMLMGELEIWRSHPDRARCHLERAQQGFAALGDRHFEAAALFQLAMSHAELDDMPGADAIMARSLERGRGGPPYLQSNLDIISANLDRKAGREERAVRTLEGVAARMTELGDSAGALHAQVPLADALLCLGDLEAASRVIQEARIRAGQCGKIFYPLCLQLDQAELHLATGQPALAVLSARDAVVLSRHIQHRGMRLACTWLLGLSLLLAGELPEALAVLEATAAHPQGDDGARHLATLAVARARAGGAAVLPLLEAAEQTAVIPLTRRWVAWCRAAVRPDAPALEPGPGVYERIGRALVWSRTDRDSLRG